MTTSAMTATVQTAFDFETRTFGTPLPGVTFIVVDLETTGGAPAEAGITEIGAVAVRAGEIVGEFDPKTTTVQELGLYMAGARKQGKESK